MSERCWEKRALFGLVLDIHNEWSHILGVPDAETELGRQALVHVHLKQHDKLSKHTDLHASNSNQATGLAATWPSDNPG